jgi:hypothetical protein
MVMILVLKATQFANVELQTIIISGIESGARLEQKLAAFLLDLTGDINKIASPRRPLRLAFKSFLHFPIPFLFRTKTETEHFFETAGRPRTLYDRGEMIVKII